MHRLQMMHRLQTLSHPSTTTTTAKYSSMTVMVTTL